MAGLFSIGRVFDLPKKPTTIMNKNVDFEEL